jgi:hypothetical protein
MPSEIAETPSFSHTVENEKAPTLHGGEWERGATFYWRVARVDACRNSGNYASVRAFRLRLPRSRYSALLDRPTP